jgi:pimeloyl-ACP methyl ester carboxylesterase
MMVANGSGTPLILIPGLQGRWEYMSPTVDALAAQSFQVLTFSLCGERSSGLRFEPSRGFDNYTAQVVRALDECHLDRAVICGVSFGGLIAVHFAATYPQRTTALVLASTPGPTWHLRRRHRVYARVPWLFGPLFLMEAPFRLRRELLATFPESKARRGFALRQVATLFRAPLSLRRMGERGRMLPKRGLLDDCSRITAPTLVVTGERGLDHVVPVNGSCDYLPQIVGARSGIIERTGHLGVITRPHRFATLVRAFVPVSHAA